MPASMHWHIPGRVLYQRLYGDLTLEDIHQLNRDFLQMRASEGTGKVHSILDVRDVGEFPRQLRELNGILTPDATGTSGWMVVVTTNPLIRFIASVTVHLAQLRMHTCTQVEDAERFLLHHDATLSLPTRVS